MWYYAEGEQQRGPVSDQDLTALMQSGTVRPETLVWREGQAGWEPAIDVVPQHLRPDSDGSPPPLPGEAGSPAAAPPRETYTPTDAETGSYAGEDSWPAHHPYSFGESVRHVLKENYLNFKGRARRREFWWFILFCLLAGLATGFLDAMLFPGNELTTLNTLFTLLIIIPSLAVGARRLHDIGRTG